MAIDPEKVRLVAKSLRKNGEDVPAAWEPFCRSALSRLYYSLYLRARAWAGKQEPKYEGKPPGEPGSSHKDLWRHMSEKTGCLAFIEQANDQCHTARCKADYDIGQPFTPKSFDFHWRKMEKMHELMDLLPDIWAKDPIPFKPDVIKLNYKVKELWPDD